MWLRYGDSLMSPLLLAPASLAAALGLSTQTIYNRLATGGDLPPVVRIGRLPRFHQADVHIWLNKKRQAPPPACTTAAPKRRPGRPTKAEQIAARRAA